MDFESRGFSTDDLLWTLKNMGVCHHPGDEGPLRRRDFQNGVHQLHSDYFGDYRCVSAVDAPSGLTGTKRIPPNEVIKVKQRIQ
jgi:hypothetical protein